MMRDKNMKKLIRAGFCLVLLLIVLLVLVALQHVLEKKQPDKKDSTETVTESMDGRADDATEAVLETETETETEVAQSGVVTLHNAMIENVEGFDNTSQGWGMGPTRDEFNRPVDALNYEEKFGAVQRGFYQEYRRKSGLSDL